VYMRTGGAHGSEGGTRRRVINDFPAFLEGREVV
jgi:hypothetical protein